MTLRLTISIFWTATLVVFGGRNVVAADKFNARVKPFFKTYCVRCHGAKNPKGDISLHVLKDSFSKEKDLKRWNLILEMVEGGQMPPEDQRQPKATERNSIIEWINRRLRVALQRHNPVTKGPTTRRLTNLEFQNTIRDLLGFELKLVDHLPKDPTKPYRFNNSAEFMRLGPERIDRYLECARRAMASAIVDPAKPQVYRSRRRWRPFGVARGLGGDEVGVWGNRRNTPAWGMTLRKFPKKGEFRIRVKASAILPAGVSELPLRLVMGYSLNVNSSTQRIEPIGTVAVTNTVDQPQVFEFRGRMENFPRQPGRKRRGRRLPESITITPQNLYDDGTLNDENGFYKPRNVAMPRAVIHSIEFAAPVFDEWPPRHHTRILFASPLRRRNPPAYVRAVLTRFMTRAFRRPATKAEVNRFARIYGLVLPKLKTMEAALRETLAMVLVSPQFLYHATTADHVAANRTSGEFSQFELASRLSYFLWASMPDEELMQLAARKKLSNPHEIERQVRRMLADRRSQAFVDNFATQWLSLTKMKTVPINRDLFPRFLYYVPVGERAGTEVPYRPTIRDYMHQETVGFIAETIKRNSSILSIVDSDFAYLNQPLAAHYGVEGVQGHRLRAVQIKPKHRLGGLLTQGSILIGNGTGSAPHPIYRAVWLREAILGDEVPPPPAEVPALEDSVGKSAEQALTIKDLLAQHRKVASCNSCHSRLDPWGIPFERYNAIGRFQPLIPRQGTRVRRFNKKKDKNLAGYAAYLKSINKIQVHADARVPHGPRIDGMRQLKAYLLQHKRDQIIENVLRRLLTYAIGRKLSYRDRFGIKALVKAAKSRKNRMQDAIVLVCQSELFVAGLAHVQKHENKTGN